MGKIQKVKTHKSKSGLEFQYTHDYCIMAYGLKFRDVRGKDLTYLDFVFNEYEKEYLTTIDFAVEFLSKFLVTEGLQTDLPPDQILLSVPPIALSKLLNLYFEKVLKSPPSRDTWMNNVFFLSGKNFGLMPYYEEIPMSEFVHMTKVFLDIQEKEKEDVKNV